nr:ribonuclease H-like domain-containing protein [Tanacetum cinerariifolium]
MRDNKGVIELSKNPIQQSRTKHIEIRHQFLLDNIQKGNISIKKVSSEDNIVGNKMHKAFPLPVTEFPLPEELPTAREDSYHCQKKREATARKIALLSMLRRNCQSKVAITLRESLLIHITLSFHTHQEMDQQYPIVAKIPILDTGKFELWQFWIQQYLQHEHYALWEATKKTKKNLLKQQYGNFRAEGSETLEQTFSRLQVIIGQLQFMDVEFEHDDLNQKFLTSLDPEWLMHTIVWRNRSYLDTMRLDDLYNHHKVYESEVQKKTEPNSQNMAFISSATHNSKNEDGNTAYVPTASANVPTVSASVATISQDTACAYITSQSSGSQIKFEDINQINKDDMEEMDMKWNMELLSMRADKF